MSPPNMHFHDNYLIPYCSTTVSNLEMPPTANLYYTIPPPPLQYSQWCVQHGPFMHPYPPQLMEYQNPVPKRVSEECGAPTKKLKFSIESILGLSNEGNVTSVVERSLYENCPDENLDLGLPYQCLEVPPYLHSEHRDDDASPKPSCISDSSRSSSPERGGKQKRMRTIFSPEQLQKLEQEFARQQYLVGDERLYLAECLGLTETQVKVWFQNRRIKYRREVTDMEKNKLLQLQSTEIKTEEKFRQEMSPSSPEQTENTLS